MGGIRAVIYRRSLLHYCNCPMLFYDWQLTSRPKVNPSPNAANIRSSYTSWLECWAPFRSSASSGLLSASKSDSGTTIHVKLPWEFESNVFLSFVEQAKEEQIHGLGHGSPHRALHQESHHRTASVRQRNARAFGQLMVQLSVCFVDSSYFGATSDLRFYCRLFCSCFPSSRLRNTALGWAPMSLRCLSTSCRWTRNGNSLARTWRSANLWARALSVTWCRPKPMRF